MSIHHLLKRHASLLLLSACLLPAEGCKKSDSADTEANPQNKAEHTATPTDKILVADSVVTMDAGHRIVTHGAVAIQKNTIVKVGTEAEAQAALPGAKIFRYPGKVIMPGLVNAHTHISMSLLRGISDDKDLMEWLNNYIFPAEKKNVTAAFSAAGARLSCMEMLLGGTTMLADMYYFPNDIATELDKCGIRGMVGTTFIDFPAPDNKTWEEMVASSKTFVEKWKNNPRIIPALAPHAPYTVSKEHLQEVAALSKSLNAHVLIHVAESESETKTIQEKYGMSPVAYLNSIGFWGPNVTAAHMVQLKNEDIDIVKNKDVGIAHCPQSNMKLTSGIAPVAKYLEAHVRTGLGTDGAASNNDQDMFDEMRAAALLHKVANMNPKTMDAQTTLEMATIGGARALHMENTIGSLEEGKLADIVVVDMDAPHQTPVYNIVSQLVYATKSSDVDSVMVNGNFVVRGKKILTLNQTTVLKDARLFADQIKRSLQ